MTYYEDQDVVLHLGDCVEVMKTLEPVDAIVTDPPTAWSSWARNGIGWVLVPMILANP